MKMINTGRFVLIRKNWLASGFLILGMLVSVSFINTGAYQGMVEFIPYAEQIPDSNAEIDLVPIQGGTFDMGAPDGEGHEVHVDDFWMGTHEITWEQYDQFTSDASAQLRSNLPYEGGDVEIEADAIALPTAPYVDMTFGMGRDGYPAISMTHYAAVMFTKWLTAKTGTFYRLPTEAEWEYACRAGSESATYLDVADGDLEDYEWHSENSDRSYNLVASKQPNPWGLYDMKGNIAEWTMDQYVDDYIDRLDEEPAINPWLKPTELYPRTVRGGSWRDGPGDASCSMRRGSHENWKQLDPQFPKSLWWHTSAQFVGFRIVRPYETPSQEEMEEYWIEAMDDY